MNSVRKVQVAEKNQVAKWKTKQSGFSLNDKKEQILADCGAEIQKHKNFQADYDRRSIQNLMSLNEVRLIMLLQEINYFFMNNYQNEFGIFVKLT